MASFVIHGPFEVTYENCKGGLSLVFNGFWSKSADAEKSICDTCWLRRNPIKTQAANLF